MGQKRDPACCRSSQCSLPFPVASDAVEGLRRAAQCRCRSRAALAGLRLGGQRDGGGPGVRGEWWQGKQRRVPGQGLWGLACGGSASRAPKVGTAPAGRGIVAVCQVMPPLSAAHVFLKYLAWGRDRGSFNCSFHRFCCRGACPAAHAAALVSRQSWLPLHPLRPRPHAGGDGRARPSAPPPPRTDLKGCRCAGQPCCQSVWWVAHWRQQCLHALILG